MWCVSLFFYMNFMNTNPILAGLPLPQELEVCCSLALARDYVIYCVCWHSGWNYYTKKIWKTPKTMDRIYPNIQRDDHYFVPFFSGSLQWNTSLHRLGIHSVYGFMSGGSRESRKQSAWRNIYLLAMVKWFKITQLYHCSFTALSVHSHIFSCKLVLYLFLRHH